MRYTIGLGILVLLFVYSTARAQPYTIDWYTVDGGGGDLVGGPFLLSGTVGQHDAGGPLVGGGFVLTSGYWASGVVPPPCLADFNGDGLIDFFDIAEFLDAFSNQIPSADLTNDGLFDFFDVVLFLDLFSAGCP